MIYDSKTYLKDIEIIANQNIPFEKLKNKCIMITGACGLIGSFLVDVLMIRNEKFHDNITIIAYDFKEEFIFKRFPGYINNVNFKYICQDVNLPLNYNEKVDYIMHLASNAHPSLFKTDPVGTIRANIIGLDNLLNFAVLNKVTRVLYTSTGEVYGEKETESFVENDSGYVDQTKVRSCYPSSKRCAETLCVSYSEQYNIETVIARPCHTYGPTMTKNDSRVYAEFIRCVLNNQDIILKSDGKPIRSYCYVADCVSALLFILLNGENKNAYNIANKDNVISIKDMAYVIAKIGHCDVKFEINNENTSNNNPMQCGILDASKLESLGWKGVYSIEKGYQNTIDILKEISNE